MRAPWIAYFCLSCITSAFLGSIWGTKDGELQPWGVLHAAASGVAWPVFLLSCAVLYALEATGLKGKAKP